MNQNNDIPTQEITKEMLDVIQFISKEYETPKDSLSLETDFSLDLGLTPDEIGDLINKLQEEFDFLIVNDSNLAQIKTIGDLFFQNDDIR